MRFSLRKNIFDHRDIICFSFFNNSSTFFMINIYSDKHQSALQYLKNTKTHIDNVLAIVGDFNIRNSDWDSFYPFHLTHSNSLIEVADSFDLKLLSSTHQISTYYFDNLNNVNSIIDLIFLRLNSIEIDNYSILPKSQHPSDYAPLTVDIFIMEEFIQEKQHTIIRNSKEKNLSLNL